jgi:hypothetical protein
VYIDRQSFPWRTGGQAIQRSFLQHPLQKHQIWKIWISSESTWPIFSSRERISLGATTILTKDPDDRPITCRRQPKIGLSAKFYLSSHSSKIITSIIHSHIYSVTSDVTILPTYALDIMSEGAFHYEQRRLENDLVALEPFDVCVFSSSKTMSKNCSE